MKRYFSSCNRRLDVMTVGCVLWKIFFLCHIVFFPGSWMFCCRLYLMRFAFALNDLCLFDPHLFSEFLFVLSEDFFLLILHLFLSLSHGVTESSFTTLIEKVWQTRNDKIFCGTITIGCGRRVYSAYYMIEKDGKNAIFSSRWCINVQMRDENATNALTSINKNIAANVKCLKKKRQERDAREDLLGYQWYFIF